MKKNNKSLNGGFSLLEVLIALIMMTSALMGILALQTQSLRQIHAAYYQNLAAEQAQALMERLRAEPAAGGFSQELTLAQPAIENLLPAGRGEYHCSGTPLACAVLISWQDHGEHTFTLNSLL